MSPVGSDMYTYEIIVQALLGSRLEGSLSGPFPFAVVRSVVSSSLVLTNFSVKERIFS